MSTFSTKDDHTTAIAVLIVGITLLGLNKLFTIASPVQGLFAYTNYIATGLGAYLGLYGAYKIGVSNFIGKALLFLGLSSFFSGVGYLLWDYYEFILGIEAQYPSLAEVSWSLGVPCGLIGYAFLLHIYRPQIKLRFIVEALSIFSIMSVIVISIIGLPDLTQPSLVEGILNVYYTLTDALLLSLSLITIRLAGGKVFRGLFVYTIAAGLLAVGDLWFIVRNDAGIYFYGDISDLLLMSGWLLAAAGMYFTAQAFNTNSTTHTS